MEEVYIELSKRNNWKYFVQDNRPYFYSQEGGYAVPDDKVSIEDKELLASIIAEGSEELAKIAVTCWNNNILISGPCSGIDEYHQDKDNVILHVSFIGPMEIIKPLYDRIKAIYPLYISDDLRLVKNGLTRIDIGYSVGKGITHEEANEIFRNIRRELCDVLGIQMEMSK